MRKRALRIDQMTVNIEKMRFDMTERQKQAAMEQKWETRKFLVSAVLATAAAVGAGIAIGSYFANHSQPPAAPVAVYQVPPGTTITTSKAAP
jgi:hypothetical protein